MALRRSEHTQDFGQGKEMEMVIHFNRFEDIFPEIVVEGRKKCRLWSKTWV